MLGERARGVGEKIKGTWDALGNSVGQAIIRFGCAIHSMLYAHILTVPIDRCA